MLKMFATIGIITLISWYPTNILMIFYAHAEQIVKSWSRSEYRGMKKLDYILGLLWYTVGFSSVVIYFIFDKNFRVSRMFPFLIFFFFFRAMCKIIKNVTA